MKGVEGVEDLNSCIICAQGIVGGGCFHPHFHCLVTGGGLSDDGAIWHPAGKTFLFPKTALATLARARFHDVVTVTRIELLARSTFDLFAIVKRIVDAKAQFRSLAEPWADTGTSTGRLMPQPPSRSEGSLDHPQARLAPLAVIVH